MHKNDLKTNTFVFILLIFTFLSSTIYAEECKFKNQIEEYESNPHGLSGWFNSQLEKAEKDKSQSLEGICYYYIGKVYYECSLKNDNAPKKELLLQSAIENLKWAANTLGKKDQEKYRLCHRYLIKALCLTNKPDHAEIRKYFKRVPQFKPFEEPIVVNTIQQATGQVPNHHLESSKNTSDPLKKHHLLIKAEANSSIPDLQKIYESIQVQGVPEKIQDTDRQLILSAIDKQIKPYLTRFTANDEPPEYVIELYRQLNTQSSDNYSNLDDVRTFRQNYQTIRDRLEQHTSQNIIEDITSIVRALDQYSNTMQDIQPFLNAYRLWHRTLQDMQILPEGAINKCSRTKELLNDLNTVRQTFSFAKTPQELTCRNRMACLVNQHPPQDILPTFDDHQREQRQQTCEAWISSYSDAINTCGTAYLIEDLRTFLNEVRLLHNALESYYSNNSTRSLESIHTSTHYDQIRKISANYLARHYYTIVVNDLQRGPVGGDALRTLGDISGTLDLYNRYSAYMKRTGIMNINQQHQLLTNFFSNISSNFTNAEKNIRLINDKLRTIWNIQEMLISNRAYTQRPTQQAAQRPTKPPSQRQMQSIVQYPAQQPAQRQELQSDQRQDSVTHKARKAFDNFEYFVAWKQYKQVYSDIVPSRLDDLVRQNEGVYINETENIWSVIHLEDKIRLKILSIIIKLVNSQNIPDSKFDDLVSNRTTGYYEDYSFHLAESGHSQVEKSSDRDFITALYFFMKNSDNYNNYSYEMIRLFLAAYQALGQGLSQFNLPTAKRIRNKYKRLEYWIIKVWNEHDRSWKELVRSRYYRIYPAIFDTLILSNDNMNTIKKIAVEANAQLLSDSPKPTEKAFKLFEKFADDYELKGISSINCNLMRSNYHSRIQGTENSICVENYIQLIKSEYKELFYYRFFLAWAKIRKAQDRIDDWIENLAIAYSQASPENEKQIVKESLAEAKKKYFDQNISLHPRLKSRIRRHGLYDYWNKIPPHDSNSTDTIQFETPKEARRIAKQFQLGTKEKCQANRKMIIKFINQLSIQYRDTDNEQYRKIYNSFIPRCRCFNAEDMASFDVRFMSLD